MAHSLQVFAFEGCPVRTVRGTDGETWFVARDVAEVLDPTLPPLAVRSMPTSGVCTVCRPPPACSRWWW
jgi:prophage antirepressor-like protein